MKERLISFTRNKENMKKARKGYLIILIILLAIYIFNIISVMPAEKIVVCAVFIAMYSVIYYALDILAKNEENVIRKNNIILVLFSNEGFVQIITLWMIVLSPLDRLLMINNSILSILFYVAILFILLFFIPSKISKYFSKKLKEL